MRKIYLLFLLTLLSGYVSAQGWTEQEIRSANTAAGIKHLTREEKNVILYLNLARMYPRRFAQLELPEVPTTANEESLIQTLNYMTPVPPCYYDDEWYRFARAWAAESGDEGVTGHDRINTIEPYGTWAENCSYGCSTGKDVILQLLIDEGVPSLGHRENCLNPAYAGVGASIHSHKRTTYCCVMDFRPLAASTVAQLRHEYESYMNALQHESEEAYDHALATKTAPAQPTYVQPTHSAPVQQPTSVQQPHPAPVPAESATTAEESPVRESLLTRYFHHNGRLSTCYFGGGYTYGFPGGDHMVSLELFEFRMWLFGLSWLDFEMGVAPMSKWFAYRPSMRVYIPTCKWLSLFVYGGAEVDLTYLGPYVWLDYKFNYDNYFLDAFGGIGLQFTPARRMPIDLKLEYRHPITHDLQPKGMYLTTKIYFAGCFRRK